MAEYIERDEAVRVAIEACVEVCKDITGHGITQIHAVEIAEKIENVPAADVDEVRHGKWIKRNNERRCPICHFFYMTNGTTDYNLCPMCGTKMDGERK